MLLLNHQQLDRACGAQKVTFYKWVLAPANAASKNYDFPALSHFFAPPVFARWYDLHRIFTMRTFYFYVFATGPNCTHTTTFCNGHVVVTAEYNYDFFGICYDFFLV